MWHMPRLVELYEVSLRERVSEPGHNRREKGRTLSPFREENRSLESAKSGYVKAKCLGFLHFFGKRLSVGCADPSTRQTCTPSYPS